MTMTEGEVPPPFLPDVRLARLGRHVAFDATWRVLQVYGPTGLGKTTLLSAAAHAASADVQYRWLDVEPSHMADPAVFLDALAGAILARAGGDAPAGTRATGERLGAVRAWVNAAPHPVMLVVDAGNLDLGSHGKVLGHLLQCTGAGLRLSLISRTPCSPMLAQLRSPHLVRSILPAQLAFTPDEGTAYRRQAGHEAASCLHGVTLGWPIAEATAAGMADADRNPGGLLDDAGGLLAAVIHDNIWLGLSDAVRRVLADTSMLDTVETGLLARLAGPEPVHGILHDIDRLAPLGQVRHGPDGGFTLHPLLRTFAARQLLNAESGRRAAAYRHALLHLAQAGAPEAAIALVQNAGDQALARMAFETFTSTDLLRSSGYGRLKLAMAQMAPHAVEQSAQICITQAIVAMKDGRFREARRLLQAAGARLSEDMAYQSPTLSRVYADYVIAQHVLAFHSHTELTDAQVAEGAFWSSYTNDLTNAAFVHALRSLHYLRRGDTGQAQEQIEAARSTYERAASYYGLGSALLVEAMIALASGRLEHASKLADDARLLIAQAMPDDAGLIAVADCILCEVQLERGHTQGLPERINAALRDLEAGEGWPDAFVIGYRVGARAALTQDDPDGALALLDRGIRLMRGRGLRDIEGFCRMLRAGVVSCGYQGDGEHPRARWRQLDTEADHASGLAIGWRASDEACLLDAQEALDLRDRDTLEHVVTGLLDDAETGGRRNAIIRALVFRALCAFEFGAPDTAIQALYRAISLAEPEGVLQPFIEGGAALLLVMEKMKAASFFRAARRNTRSFCAAVVKAIAGRAKAASGGLVFAPRELQVLQLLAQRQATKTIARELDVSASAVKFHLQNIFQKLGVNKRAEAVLEAQRLGVVAASQKLLPPQ
ncbi:LuxR C-terminal-related transcriptional regulator [Novosphingobium sp. Leaf2]|uniref:LuxR C-terminal-related transcriptional regulator n=1 Tax=Novosphingobium sp. Leaf2 TaxID=1735670 RepID=UPI0006F9D04E|nr:LuxR C-terminal-related transcriptional regulator [Novosphingobium sp. Leaf2]KQM18244.1 hypothetical protein ASE49_08425 [Novosphingobium sp. Leaf2]